MTKHAVLPDTEAALVAALAAHADLLPLHGGRVGTEVRSDLPCLQVTSLGGTMPMPYEAVHEFQISVWGGTKQQANQLARTVAAVTYDLSGTDVTGGRIVGVDVRLAPLWSPDETTGRARYRVDIALRVFP